MAPRKSPLSVLIVDDEPLARQGLARIVAAQNEFTVAGQCADGGAAIRAIRALQPDLVLLDVQMPPPDGLAVVRAIGTKEMPPVIFVTAHDQHAIAAFESHAMDYLLKPFTERRLLEALGRARELLESRRLGELARRLLGVLGDSAPTEPTPSLDRLVVRSVGKTEIVPVAEIRWIEAAGYCVRIHTRQRTIVHREPLSALEARLPAGRFVRIHRSALVRLDQIREARVTRSEEHEVILEDGTRLKVSRSRWHTVDSLFRKWRQG